MWHEPGTDVDDWGINMEERRLLGLGTGCSAPAQHLEHLGWGSTRDVGCKDDVKRGWDMSCSETMLCFCSRGLTTAKCMQVNTARNYTAGQV